MNNLSTGTASVARGYSVYIDSLFNNAISNFFKEYVKMDISNLSAYPDLLAGSIILLLMVMVIFGVKESTRFNSTFTCINILIVLYVILCGVFKANPHNWNLSYDEVPHPSPEEKRDGGAGGFFPFGFAGVMQGAATCFYAFVGFDIIATSAEEAINPSRTIPLSIIISLTIVFFAYLGVSGIVTLLWPYYDLKNDAPLPYVFGKVGWPLAKWIVTIGGLAGLSTSLLGGIFPLPRVFFAMARDGLIFKSLAYVHPRFATPIYATLVGGSLAALLAVIFDIEQLAAMMSIGTLLAYSLASLSVVLLRYRDDAEDDEASKACRTHDSHDCLAESLTSNFFAYIWNTDNTKIPNRITTKLANLLIGLCCKFISQMKLLLLTN